MNRPALLAQRRLAASRCALSRLRCFVLVFEGGGLYVVHATDVPYYVPYYVRYVEHGAHDGDGNVITLIFTRQANVPLHHLGKWLVASERTPLYKYPARGVKEVRCCPSGAWKARLMLRAGTVWPRARSCACFVGTAVNRLVQDEARRKRIVRENAAREARHAESLRSPIVCIMGHVDTGKHADVGVVAAVVAVPVEVCLPSVRVGLHS